MLLDQAVGAGVAEAVLTDGPRMVLTPTYHAFDLYKPFRGATPLKDTQVPLWGPALVAVVNETFAETFWRGRDPIGQRVRPGCGDQLPWATVVGVARDVKQAGLDRQAGTELYLMTQQVAKLPPRLPPAISTVPLTT